MMSGFDGRSEFPKILIFSEDPITRSEASELLSGKGYNIAELSLTREAVLHLQDSYADIVLLDLATNEIHGTEIMRAAKERNPEVSFILMGTEEAVKANPNLLLFGGYEYVLKPLQGEILRAVVEQRLNQQRIYRICSALSSTLDPDKTLDLILETAVRETKSDNGVILLSNSESGLLQVAAAYGLPNDVIGAAHRTDDAEITSLIMENEEAIIFQGGFARLPFIPGRILSEISSSICAPIRINGRRAGLLNINRVFSAIPFSQSDLRMIQIIVMQAAMALTNAHAHSQALERQRIQHELEMAHSIQKSLLPMASVHKQWVHIEPRSRPAQMIGGDFFDFVEFSPDRFGIAIGDVAGKGVPGALLMVRAISSLRLRVGPEKSPGTVLQQLNDDLIRNRSRGMYVTVIYAVFDLRRNKLQFANAGHPPPILLLGNSSAETSKDVPVGIPVGIMDHAEFETVEMDFHPGDFAFFYTDGVTEARNAENEEFSILRLENLLRASYSSVQRLADSVLRKLNLFTTGRPQHDDLTLVAVGTDPS